MDILKTLTRKKENIDFLFPNNFNELMNHKYYDYDKFEWFLYHVFKFDKSINKVHKLGKKGRGDGGADLILDVKQEGGGLRRIGIQAKYWKNRVGASYINQLASARDVHSLTDLYLITTSDLTPDAQKIAEVMNITILRKEDVIEFIEVVKKKYDDDISEHGESQIVFIKPEPQKVKTKKEAKAPKTKEPADDKIVGELKSLRFELGKKHKLMPVYTVFNNETLSLILSEKPTTLEELVKIKGLGPKKIELFGHEIIGFVKSKVNVEPKDVTEADQILLELLIKERTKIAQYNKLSEEDVYSDRVAGYLAKMKPRNKDELAKIFGFKKENIEIFGDYLLKIISVNR